MVAHIEVEQLFENRVLRIIGPKRKEVLGAWIKLCNEELSDMYASSNIMRVKTSRRMGMAGHVESMGERRAEYRGLLVKPEGKRPG